MSGQTEFPKKKVLEVLRKVGITRDQLVSMMGGSP